VSHGVFEISVGIFRVANDDDARNIPLGTGLPRVSGGIVNISVALHRRDNENDARGWINRGVEIGDQMLGLGCHPLDAQALRLNGSEGLHGSEKVGGVEVLGAGYGHAPRLQFLIHIPSLPRHRSRD